MFLHLEEFLLWSERGLILFSSLTGFNLAKMLEDPANSQTPQPARAIPIGSAICPLLHACVILLLQYVLSSLF